MGVFRMGIVALGLVGLLGCGEDAPQQKPDKQEEEPSAWAGRWEGSMDCEGLQDDGSGLLPKTVEETLPLVLEFDRRGRLLLPAGDKLVPQSKEGQEDEWQAPEGGIGKRELTHFDDKEESRVYRFSETFDLARADGTSVNRMIEEEYLLGIHGDTLTGAYKLSLDQEERRPAGGGATAVRKSWRSVICPLELQRI